MPGKRSSSGKSSGLRHSLVEGEILECAARLFSDRGYAATSMQDIAEGVGTSRSSLYHYYSNKEEMLIRLVSDLVHGGELALREMEGANEDGAVLQLRLAVEKLLGPIVEAPSRFRLLLTVEAELPANIAGQWRETRREIVSEVSKIIQAGVRSGEFRPVDEQIATFTVLGMCNWVAWWPERQREDLEALQRGIADLAVSGLASDGDALVADSPMTAVRAAREQLDRLEALLVDAGPPAR